MKFEIWNLKFEIWDEKIVKDWLVPSHNNVSREILEFGHDLKKIKNK